MKLLELRLIAELMKNSRRSDRVLAKVLGVSQPTVTRTRTSLEKRGLIEYTAIPDFGELGYGLLVFTLSRRDVIDRQPQDAEKCKKYQQITPNFVFGADVEGSGYDKIGVSLHKNFTEFSKYMQRAREFWGQGANGNSFIVDLKNGTDIRPLSFKALAGNLQEDVALVKANTTKQKTVPTENNEIV